MCLYTSSFVRSSVTDLILIYILFLIFLKSLIDSASTIMSVDRIVLNHDNDIVKSKKRNTVRLAYTDCFYDEFKNVNYHQREQYVLRIASINKQNELLMFCKFDTSESRKDEVFETVIDVEKIIKDTCYQVSYLKKEIKRLQRLRRWCFKNKCRWKKHFDNLEINTLSHAYFALKHADIFQQWLCIWWSINFFDINCYLNEWIANLFSSICSNFSKLISFNSDLILWVQLVSYFSRCTLRDFYLSKWRKYL